LLENGAVKLPSSEPKEVELEAVLLSAAGLDFGLARFVALLEAAGFFAALRFLAVPPLFALAFFRAGAAFFALLFVALFLADVFVFLALVFVLLFFVALAMIFLLVICPSVGTRAPLDDLLRGGLYRTFIKSSPPPWIEFGRP
jgi:hypothetical protein